MRGLFIEVSVDGRNGEQRPRRRAERAETVSNVRDGLRHASAASVASRNAEQCLQENQIETTRRKTRKTLARIDKQRACARYARSRAAWREEFPIFKFWKLYIAQRGQCARAQYPQSRAAWREKFPIFKFRELHGAQDKQCASCAHHAQLPAAKSKKFPKFTPREVYGAQDGQCACAHRTQSRAAWRGKFPIFQFRELCGA